MFVRHGICVGRSFSGLDILMFWYAANLTFTGKLSFSKLKYIKNVKLTYVTEYRYLLHIYTPGLQHIAWFAKTNRNLAHVIMEMAQ